MQQLLAHHKLLVVNVGRDTYPYCVHDDSLELVSTSHPAHFIWPGTSSFIYVVRNNYVIIIFLHSFGQAGKILPWSRSSHSCRISCFMYLNTNVLKIIIIVEQNNSPVFFKRVYQ